MQNVVTLNGNRYLIEGLKPAESSWMMAELGPAFTAAAVSAADAIPSDNATEDEVGDFMARLITLALDSLTESELRRVWELCSGVCRIEREGELSPVPSQISNHEEDMNLRLQLVLEVFSRTPAAPSGSLLLALLNLRPAAHA